ncbi:MAG: SRPBCC family protein [Armatimonadetes bacterium]|nr:SRPBCC family protein [Armatimonadota bacterium]
MRPQNPKWALFAGYAVSQVVGLGALALVAAIFVRFNAYQANELVGLTAGILGFSHFFLIPFGMGFIAAYFWLDLPSQRTHNARRAAFNTLIACFGAALVLREGAMCLMMAFFLLWVFMWSGLDVGQHFWRKNPFLSVSLVPLFLLLVWAEATHPPTQTFAVSTQFHSSASPQSLWKYTANYPRNPHPANWWLYRMGLPAPLQSTGRAVVGGRRDCVLTGGVSIGEKIVVAEPNRKLEFVIDRQPQHPEIVHHFVLERGRIELFPDGRGGTILKGTSWYRLNVAPAAYFDLWSAAIVRQTHARVFGWMDELARGEGTISDSSGPAGRRGRWN